MIRIVFIIILSNFYSLSMAGGWTLPLGNLWIKSSFFALNTDQRFVSSRFFCGSARCENGAIDKYFFNGQLKSFASFLEFRYGITNRLEAEFVLPYYILSFRDDVNPSREEQNSIGDIRFGFRYNLLKDPLIYTFHIQAKAPTGFFVNDAETVPIGDGQWDLWLNNQISKSFWPIHGYVSLDLGYRIRFRPNLDKTNFAPGDEYTFWFELGYNLTENLLLKGSVNGFIGKEGEAILSNGDQVLKRNESDRQIIYAEPGIYWTMFPQFSFEASVKFPIAGKNFPAGNVYGVGFSYNLPILD